MYIRAIDDGEEYNDATVDVTEDATTGYPSYMKVELPDGSTAGYNLSPVPGTAGVITKVSDLVNLINANENFAGKIYAGYDYLTKEVDVTVTQTLVSGTVDTYTVDRTYDLDPTAPGTNESWGDKMVGLVKVYQLRDVQKLTEAGDSSVELD
ncbi:hypothetical protein ACFL20_10040, partial [Spirochaetota bacterium]